MKDSDDTFMSQLQSINGLIMITSNRWYFKYIVVRQYDIRNRIMFFNSFLFLYFNNEDYLVLQIYSSGRRERLGAIIFSRSDCTSCLYGLTTCSLNCTYSFYSIIILIYAYIGIIELVVKVNCNILKVVHQLTFPRHNVTNYKPPLSNISYLNFSSHESWHFKQSPFPGDGVLPKSNGRQNEQQLQRHMTYIKRRTHLRLPTLSVNGITVWSLRHWTLVPHWGMDWMSIMIMF